MLENNYQVVLVVYCHNISDLNFCLNSLTDTTNKFNSRNLIYHVQKYEL